MSDNPPNVDLTAKVGVTWPARECAVDKDLIRRFTQAIGDPNPHWQKVAPPTLTAILGFEQFMEEALNLASFATLLHGKTDLEFFQLVKPKDTITVSTKVSDIRQRQGKAGSIAFITFDTTYTNQEKELVARCQQLVIGYQGKEI